MIKNLPAIQETQVQTLGWEESLEKGMAIHIKYSCLENFMTEELAGHGVTESQT